MQSIDRPRKRGKEVAMKTGLLIVLSAIVFVSSSILAVMNSACKTSHHTWCAPARSAIPHSKPGHG
jgi:hypothetical protein